MIRYLAIFALCLCTLPAFAACPDATNNAGYITPSGNGSHTGADWSNTCVGFSGACAPGSLVRGCTYFVGVGGTVGNASVAASPAYCIGDETCVFSAADSGTSIIKIQTPTSSAHGTNTGYTSAVLGQSVFGPISITTDYWTFNGAYNDLMTVPSGNISSYGMVISNGGAGTAVDSNYVIFQSGSHITEEYLDISGPYNFTNASAGDVGEWSFGSSSPSSNNSWLHNHMHDSSIYPGPKEFGETNDVIEYNYINSNCCVGGTAHRGALNPAVYNSTGSTNLTIAYNYMANLGGTAAFDFANSGTGAATNNGIYMYGNVIWCNTADNYSGDSCGFGDGVVSMLGNTPTLSYTNIYFVHNIIDGLAQGGDQCSINYGGGHDAVFTTVVIQDNIFTQCSSGVPQCSAYAQNTCTGPFTQDSNSFWNNSQSNWGTNIGTIASNPYVNAGNNVASDNNYVLAFDVPAVNLIGSPYNIDLLGNTFTTSAGAYQFNGSGPTVTPAPALGMFAWDWDPLEGIAP